MNHIRCELCGDLLEEQDEKERGLCNDCLQDGFYKLREVIRKMHKEHG